MKWLPNKTFPHPVLSDGNVPAMERDYVQRCFQPTDTMMLKGGEIKLDVSFKMSEQSLLDLVAQGKAKYVVEIHCRETFLRRTLAAQENRITHVFQKGDLQGGVDISFYLVAMTEIRGHASETIHSEFGSNSSFDFSPGSVLAIAEPATYWFDMDPVRAIGSIIDLVPEDGHGDNFSVKLGKDKIQVIMNKEDAKFFTSMQNNKSQQGIALSAICFPVFLQVLHLMNNDIDGEHEGKRWYYVIKQELANKRIDLDKNPNLLEVAQQLLDSPVHYMMARGEIVQ